MDNILCPFCREPIDPNAQKCRYCHEFLNPKKDRLESKSSRLEVYRITLDFLSKFAIPAIVLVILLIFKPNVDSLLRRTNEAELLGSKFKFATISAYTGFISSKIDELAKQDLSENIKEIIRQIKESSDQVLGLHPLSIYYLIGSAEGGTLHYKYAYLKHKEYIDALKENGLATLEVIEGDPDASFEGAKGLEIIPTNLGREFLENIGIQITNLP